MTLTDLIPGVSQAKAIIGAGSYCRSTVARRFNAGNWRGGCDAMLAWKYAGGRLVRGLELRRQRERTMCMEGL